MGCRQMRRFWRGPRCLSPLDPGFRRDDGGFAVGMTSAARPLRASPAVEGGFETRPYVASRSLCERGELPLCPPDIFPRERGNHTIWGCVLGIG